MKIKQLSLGTTSLILLLSVYFAIGLNFVFFREILYINENTPSLSVLIGLPVLLICFLTVLFNLLMIPYIHKVIFPLLIVLSAPVIYSEYYYGIYFTTDMLENVLQTDLAESSRMISVSYALFVIILGLVPALLYIAVKRKTGSLWHEFKCRGILFLIPLLVAGAMAVFDYKTYAAFFRNNRQVVTLIVPSNFIAATIGEYRRYVRSSRPFETIDPNAAQSKPDSYKHLTVLIVGETTRAQNWGLNGYHKMTTPKLFKRGSDVINFKNVTSCGTATAVSVPCMFSNQDRSEYDAVAAEKSDNVLDILQRAGVSVFWLDNDSGCKGVCNRIPTENVTSLNFKAYCSDGECKDNILLPRLENILINQKNDTVVVLHTIGNHGPTYYERYSDKERIFTPTCDTQEIQNCTDEELVNTYDNAVVYVDQFIDRVISLVENRDELETAVIYLSDHGESLGENGVYLHGAPYALAPDTQNHVPMVFWFNRTWIKNEGIDLDCVRNNAITLEYSHDNFFSTVLGLMDMSLKDSSYVKEKDILEQCRVREAGAR